MSAQPSPRPVWFRPLRRVGKGAILAGLLVAAAMGADAVTAPIRAAEGDARAVSGGVAYVDGTGDVPLMPGLWPVPEAGMVFETPRGRLVEAYAKGRVSAAEVTGFYGRTLPQMGWRSLGPQRWLREGETLSLDFIGRVPNLTVRFSLAPGG